MDLNIGMIGIGTIGLVHLLSLKNIKDDNLLSKYGVNIKIRGVADINEDKLHNLKRNNPYKIDYFTSNPEEIIKDKKINLIYINTPTKFHKDYFIKIAEEGKNIFCEKPLAFSLNDIKDMMTVERNQGTLVQVGLVLRHCPILWKLKQILMEKNDLFGSRLSFLFRDTQTWPIGTRTHSSKWRKDPSLAHAGCLFEHSIHDIDLLEYLFVNNLKLSKLFAKIRYVSPTTQKKLEDVATITFEYEDGFVGDLISIWNRVRMDERRIEIFYEDSYLALDGYTVITFNTFEYKIGRKKVRLKLKDVNDEYLKAKNIPMIIPSTGAYLFENLYFLESLIKEEKPFPGLETGYKAHKIIELAYQSSKENKIISFN